VLGECIGALLPSISKVSFKSLYRLSKENIKYIINQQSLLDEPEGLPVICVGAVWRSFDLMKEGFVEGAGSQPGPIKSSNPLRSFRLLELSSTLAVGAAYLAAKEAKLDLVRDYSANAKLFFRHSFQ